MGKVHRQTSANQNTWEYPDVAKLEYRDDAHHGITRQVLVGREHGSKDFIVRYFTVPARAKTAYDQHEHQHGVVITQGKGRVLLSGEWYEIGVGDSVFTDTNEVHQFESTSDEPLCFICVIPTWVETGKTVEKKLEMEGSIS
jgi:quercetin dioxygenase-like cupin family protein